MVRAMGLNNDLGLEKSRESAAEHLAQRLGCIVVLKGAGTVVTDGARTWTNTSGHPCLGTGGTGDVLTGVIAALIGQFVAPVAWPSLPGGVQPPRHPRKPLDLYDAVRLAVHAHGLAGERWATTRHASGGMLATELTEQLPGVLEELRASA
jgi:NAD(P)H-hydrate epimerase